MRELPPLEMTMLFMDDALAQLSDPHGLIKL